MKTDTYVLSILPNNLVNSNGKKKTKNRNHGIKTKLISD